MAQKSAAPLAGDFQISGTVVDSVTGQPLSNTSVAIAPVLQQNAFTTIVTAENGHFLFAGLTAGKYTLTAQRRGYLAQTFNQHEQYFSSIAVGPDLDSNNLVFRLTANGAIFGTVTDEEGEGIRDAQVMLFQSSISGGSRSTRHRASVVTDEEGSYHFAHLPAGRYFIAVSARPWYAQGPPPRNITLHSTVDRNPSIGQGSSITIRGNGSSSDDAEPPPSPLDVAYPLTFYAGATESSGATPIDLGKGERASIDISLQPVPALHVRVNTGSSNPEWQSNASLQEIIFGGTPIPVYADSIQVSPGVMEVAGIAPGHYNMTINSWDNNGMQALQERSVNVSRSGEVDASSANSLIQLSAMVRLEAVAAMPDNARLILRNKNSPQILNESIQSKGEVEFKLGVPPGSYEVSMQSGEQIFIKNVSASGAKVIGRTIELKGTAPVTLSVLVARGEGNVSGVALREGKPFAGAMVVLIPPDPANSPSLFRRDQSDSDGTFTLANVVPGRYTLLAIENGWELEWANPEVLRKFMAQGEAVIVEPKGKYSVKVKVQ